MARDIEKLFEELHEIADELGRVKYRQDRLYADRWAIWLELREEGVLVREIAEASGVMERSVNNAFSISRHK